MRTGFDRILLAVRDVEALSPAVLRKAAQLARSARSKLEVYHAIAEPVVLMPPRTAPANANYDQVLQAAARKSQARLEKAVARARLRGVRVHCRAHWISAFEAVVRQGQGDTCRTWSLRLFGAMRRPARFFLRNVDWELIPALPGAAPLLKSSRPYKRSAVMVAVDFPRMLRTTSAPRP